MYKKNPLEKIIDFSDSCGETLVELIAAVAIFALVAAPFIKCISKI